MAYTIAAITSPKATDIPSRSAPVMAGVDLPASVSVATTDPGPTNTSRAVPSVSAKARCGSECSIPTLLLPRPAFDIIECRLAERTPRFTSCQAPGTSSRSAGRAGSQPAGQGGRPAVGERGAQPQ